MRPEDTELDRNIVELNCMRLSENNMLATMVMVKHESSDTQGVYYLRYMIQVQKRFLDAIASLDLGYESQLVGL